MLMMNCAKLASCPIYYRHKHQHERCIINTTQDILWLVLFHCLLCEYVQLQVGMNLQVKKWSCLCENSLLNLIWCFICNHVNISPPTTHVAGKHLFLYHQLFTCYSEATIEVEIFVKSMADENYNKPYYR